MIEEIEVVESGHKFMEPNASDAKQPTYDEGRIDPNGEDDDVIEERNDYSENDDNEQESANEEESFQNNDLKGNEDKKGHLKKNEPGKQW